MERLEINTCIFLWK